MPRLILSLLLVILVAIIGIGGVLDSLFDQYQNDPINEPDEFSSYRQLGKSLASTLDKQLQPQKFIKDWQQEGKLIVELSQQDSLFIPEALKHSFYAGEPLLFETDDNISMHFILPIQQKVLTFIIPPLTQKNSISLLQLLLTSAFYIGILLMVLIWLYPLIKQLSQLRKATKAFGDGQLQQRVVAKSASYIFDIETEFNSMAERIETLISDNKLLTDAVSHDLRTPLARLRFGIEALQETEKAQTRDKYQRHLSRDIEEMERLVNTLLTYARIEQSMITADKQKVDLNELVNHSVALIVDSSKCIHWQESGVAMIHGNVNYLSMLINNILTNALQYSRSKIKLNIEQTQSKVKFIISDDGSGIAKDKRDELLKPFMRGKDHDKQGYGMGLAIVARVAQLHNATLSINDSLEFGGAEFCVTFERL